VKKTRSWPDVCFAILALKNMGNILHKEVYRKKLKDLRLEERRLKYRFKKKGKNFMEGKCKRGGSINIEMNRVNLLGMK